MKKKDILKKLSIIIDVENVETSPKELYEFFMQFSKRKLRDLTYSSYNGPVEVYIHGG